MGGHGVPNTTRCVRRERHLLRKREKEREREREREREKQHKIAVGVIIPLLLKCNF